MKTYTLPISFDFSKELCQIINEIFETDLPESTIQVALTHLDSPSLSATELAKVSGTTLDEVKEAYRYLQKAPFMNTFVQSPFYPNKLLYEFAVSTVRSWIKDNSFIDRIIDGLPVYMKTIEIHPSKGTCNYSCVMCLWSDKEKFTYSKIGLSSGGLMSTDDWIRVLRDAKRNGVETIVFSGGGEVLLNSDISKILKEARLLGLGTHLYTTGFNLNITNEELWDEVMGLEKLRLSIHSPNEETYSKITGLPVSIRALSKVTEHIEYFHKLRHKLGQREPLIGIGFVIQPLNFNEIIDMAKFASELGVDFLNIRKDEVDVTDGWSEEQLLIIQEQLRIVRKNYVAGDYGHTEVDMSDELVCIANGQPITRQRGNECFAKYFRPTISPYGLVAPCDLKAEPRFANRSFNFGSVRSGSLGSIVEELPTKFIPDNCKQCMPSSRTGNAIFTKLINDIKNGIPLEYQPFAI